MLSEVTFGQGQKSDKLLKHDLLVYIQKKKTNTQIDQFDKEKKNMTETPMLL